MAGAATSIAGLIPVGQGLALTAHNLQVAKKKKITSGDILGLGVTNVVGVSLIKDTAGLASLV